MPALPRRFLQNVFTTYLAHVVLALQVLIVTPLLVDGLGPERYGIWALVASIGIFVALLDLGLGSATIRYVAEYEGRGERSNVVRTVTVSFWILFLLGGIAFCVGAAIAPLFPTIFDVQGEKSSTVLLVVLVAASVAITFVGGAFGGCLGGLQRYGVLNAFIIVAAIAQTAAFALVLALGGGLVALGATLVIVALVAQVARYVAVRRLIPETTLSPHLIESAFARKILGMTAWISSAHVAAVIRYRVDTLVVGLVVGVRAAGIYAVGQLLFVAVNRFIQPTLTGFFPFAAELAGRRDTQGLKDAMLMGTRMALAVGGPLCMATILVAGPAVYAWVGPGFEDASVVVACLVSALLLATVSKTGLLMLEGSGNVRPPVTILWLEAALNFVLSVGLGLLFGMTGVALATLIATAAVSTAVGVPYICREFGVSTPVFVGSLARAHLPAIFAALGTAWLVRPNEGANLVMVVAAGAVIALAYVATFAVTGLTRDERKRIWRRLRRSNAHRLRRLGVTFGRSSGDR